MSISLNGTTGITTPQINAGNIVGEVGFFARNTAPEGWLKANGAAVSRTTYSALFAEIGTTYGAGDGSTTFELPDMRGEFPRGWDDGRGADSGRSFGSNQGEEFKSHNHVGSSVGWFDRNNTGGGFVNQDQHFPIAGIGFTGSADILTATNIRGDGVTETRGGSETRPRNVALLACIKF